MSSASKSAGSSESGVNLERVETPAQIAAVARLAREIWTAHYVPIVGQGQVDYMLGKFQSEPAIARQLSSEGYEYYLAPELGYLALVPNPAAGTALLSKIYVKRDTRRTGQGRAMIEFAEHRCRELKCRKLWLTVNKHNTGSIAFYERLGFRITGPLLQDIGNGYVMDDWRMAKTIPARSAP